MMKINEGDYAYASARIRAMETKLLDDNRLERMIDAPDAEEALKMLSEAQYGFSGELGNVYSFEKLLSDEMEKCFAVLSEITPQIDIIKAFRRRFDYFNVKVLLKAEFSNQEPPSILMETGTISGEDMKRIIDEREYGGLTSIMRDAIEQTHDVFSRTQDPQTVDLIIDRASYQQLVADLNEIESPFLHKLAEINVDITNIKMFIRAKSMNKAWDFMERLLLDGGAVTKKTFFEHSDKSVDELVEGIRFTRYGDAVREGWEIAKKGRNISGLEKRMDNYLMEFVRKARTVTMGVEPLIAYLYAKEAEIRNVRIIMTGKMNKLPADLIRERLRVCYV